MKDNIIKLRQLLKEYKIDGFLIPSFDEYRNEFVPDHLNRLKFLTGFTGSNGLAVVTKNDAVFFTDARYLIQAEVELGSNYKIIEMGDNNYKEWFSKAFKKSEVLGYDMMLATIDSINFYSNLAQKIGFKLQGLDVNLVDELWEKPPTPKYKPAFELDIKFAGKSRQDKIKEIVKQLNTDYLLVNNPEAICWLLNIRAYDLECTPILLSKLLLGKDGKGILFCNKKQINFAIPNIEIKPIDSLKTEFLKLTEQKKTIQFDSAKTPVWFWENVSNKELIKLQTNPIDIIKSCKNNVEAAGFKQAHVEDGIALTKFLAYLFKNWQGLDEISAADQLLKFRKQQKHFVCQSFPTISAYGSNGAIMHYNANQKTNRKLKDDNLYLLDSGGQYYNGTTDVTRTVHLGKPTKEMKKNFTLVLKGHIALAMAKFPVTTLGYQLDSITRMHLWQYGLDYAHSPSHGVGHFLSVHEYPPRISKGASGPDYPLRAGMVLSNEPGYYKVGHYGIRIENLMLVQTSKIKNFLEFETLTLVPIQGNLIEAKLLSEQENQWIKQYNKLVYDLLAPHLNKLEKTWLLNYAA